MDEIEATVAAYENDAEHFVEKYLATSVVETHGERFVDALDGGRVLDVGCGPGQDVEALAAGGLNVVGFDIAPSLLQAAWTQGSDGRFVQGDMRQLPFAGNTFDGIWTCAAFHHVPGADAIPTLREFRRVLNREGIVFCSVKRQPSAGDGDRGRHFEYYDIDAFRSLLLEAGLDSGEIGANDQWVWAVATPD